MHLFYLLPCVSIVYCFIRGYLILAVYLIYFLFVFWISYYHHSYYKKLSSLELLCVFITGTTKHHLFHLSIIYYFQDRIRVFIIVLNPFYYQKEWKSLIFSHVHCCLYICLYYGATKHHLVTILCLSLSLPHWHPVTLLSSWAPCHVSLFTSPHITGLQNHATPAFFPFTSSSCYFCHS